MRKIILIVSLLFSINAFSQQLELVKDWGNSIPLVKTCDAFLIEKGRYYMMCGDFVSIRDDEFNSIGVISKTDATDLYYCSTPQTGLLFYNSGGWVAKDFASIFSISQTLFNDDENYETVYVTPDAMYINRCQYGTDGEGGSITVEGATIQTILPPNGTQFKSQLPVYAYTMKDGNYISIVTSNEHRVYYKINKSEATPINSGVMLSSRSAGKSYYDVSGKRLDHPSKGIVIVKNEDGTTQKRLYK
jgi:hypothetical protein